MDEPTRTRGADVRSAGLLLLFVAMVLVGGALLAPWAHGGMAALAEQFPVLGGLARSPFHRYVNRMCLLLALVGLWPMLRALGLKGFSGLGLRPSRGGFARWLSGVGLGLISLAIVAAFALLMGVRTLDVSASSQELSKHLLNAAGSAIAVGFLEELLFRGLVFGALTQGGHRPWVAACLSSLIYALLHFFRRPPEPLVVEWWSGLGTLWEMMAGFLEFRALVPNFGNLFLAGVILAIARRRTGDLWFSMGLHCGWVFWIKVYGRLTRPVDGGGLWFFGSDKLIDGWIGGAVLILVAWVVIQALDRAVSEHRDKALGGELERSVGMDSKRA